MASNEITPAERDLAIRTIAAEAGNQGPDGMAAVAHVLFNRKSNGGYGDNLRQIVLAPNQFEVWSAGNRRSTQGLSRNSEAYQSASKIFDDVASGKIPDPTNGATYFYAPRLQAALGRSAPGFSRTNPHTASIRDHEFYGETTPNFLGDLIQDDAGGTTPPQSRQTVPNFLNDLQEEEPTPPQKAVVVEPKSVSAPQDQPLIDLKTGNISIPGQPQNNESTRDWINRQTEAFRGPSLTNRAARGGLGFLRGVADVADTLGQGIAEAGRYGARSGLGGLISPQASKSVENWADTVEGRIKAGQQGFDRAVGDGVASTLGRVGGQIAGTAPALLAGGEALAATPLADFAVAHPVLGSVLGGAASGGATNVLTSSTSDAPLLDQALWGAGVGGALGPVGYGVGKVLGGGSIDQETAKLAQVARDKYGLNIRPSQITTNKFIQHLDSIMQSVPFSGLASHAAEQQTAFNRAIGREMGVEADKITPDIIRKAQKEAYIDYDAAKANMGQLKIDPQFYQDLHNVYNNAHYNLESGLAERVDGHLRNVLDKVASGNTIDPDLYQSLTRKNGPLDKAINSKDSKIATYAQDIKDSIESLVGRNDPKLKELKDAADYKYFVAKRVSKLADESTTGDISPIKLRKALDYSETPAGEIGRIGERFFKPPRDSGTPWKNALLAAAPSLAGGVVGGGYGLAFDPSNFQRDALYGTGLLAASPLLGAALRSKTLSNLLTRNGLQPGGRLQVFVHPGSQVGALTYGRSRAQDINALSRPLEK